MRAPVYGGAGQRVGILLAGGAGTRLGPVARAVSKQLLLVYDKPLVYYPLTTLMQAGARRIVVITTPADRGRYEALLGDGASFGVELVYEEQPRPAGIAQALIIAREHTRGRPSVLALGDNVFLSPRLGETLATAARELSGAAVLAKQVDHPSDFGVVSFDERGRAEHLEEKPARPRSSWAVTGLYFYDEHAADLAAGLAPSARGELEITDLNRRYLERGDLRVVRMGDEIEWLDTGNPEAMLEAALRVRATQLESGRLVASPEAVAFERGWIDAETLEHAATRHRASGYGAALARLLDGKQTLREAS